MSERLKRILTIIGFILIAGVIAVALFFVFLKGPSETTPARDLTAPEEDRPRGEGLPTSGVGVPIKIPGTEGGSEALPTASPIADGGVTKTEALTTGRVVAPTLTDDKQAMAYYDRTDGRFYRVSPEGEIERLSDKQFPKAETIVWNTAGEKAVIEFPDGTNIVYDFEREKQATLPAHWEDFAFSPVSDQIIAKSIGLDPNNRALVITNADGTNTKSIAALGENADKVDVSWSPNDQVVAFADTGPTISGFGRRLMIPIGKNQENYKAITVEGFDFRSQWNPQGDTILFSSVGAENGYRPMLWITDGRPNSIGDNRRSMGIETWADKCTFASNTILYCAVPQGLLPNSGLQPVLAQSVPDSIYRINIESGLKEHVAIPQTPQSIARLSVSGDGHELFFTDNATGILQRIRLK